MTFSQIILPTITPAYDSNSRMLGFVAQALDHAEYGYIIHQELIEGFAGFNRIDVTSLVWC